MTTAYKPDLNIVELVSGEAILVITQGYSDGRIIQQWGVGTDWIQIKNPDTFRRMVGTCRSCDKPIYEDDEWNFSVKEGWVEHMMEDDCTGKDESEQ